MSIHSAPTTTSFLDVLLVVVVRDGWCWSRRPPGRRLVAFSACASCLAMSRLTCPRRADALVVLFFFPLLFVKLLLFVLKEGVVAWWSCWLVVVSSPPSPSRWPWRRRSVLPRRLLSESRRPTERNVVVISHTTNAGRDSYLKRHHRIIIISRVQKGEIIITLLYNWSWCFAKARSSFLSKKKFRVGKSSLSILCVYIYIERERVKAFWMMMIVNTKEEEKRKGEKTETYEV